MAKDLPYFKFYVSEWNDGKIVDCSMEAQGLFINLCSLYWSRLGALDNATAMRKLCQRNANAYKELKIAKILKVSGDNISIEFLDEQLSDAKVRSNKNREIALKRWKNDANAMPTHSDRNANAMPIREDKTREDKSEIREYGPTHEHFVIVKAKYLHDKSAKIYGKSGLIAYMEANQTILNLPSFADKFMRNNNGKVFNELSHLQNSYNLFTQKQ